MEAEAEVVAAGGAVVTMGVIMPMAELPADPQVHKCMLPVYAYGMYLMMLYSSPRFRVKCGASLTMFMVYVHLCVCHGPTAIHILIVYIHRCHAGPGR